MTPSEPIASPTAAASTTTTPGASVPSAAPPALGPIMAKSITWTTIIMFVGLVLAVWALTGAVWDGVGIAVFCASWGGPGFGAMFGGIAGSHKLETQST